MRDRYVGLGAGGRVHVLEKGSGRPVVILPGTGDPAGFLLPLLEALRGVRLIAADRPGIGSSDPVELPSHGYREAAVSWLDPRDPAAQRATRAEFRALVSPFGLLSRDGFRRHDRVRPEEPGRLAVPTSLVWGDRDPLGSIAVARAVTGLVPDARLGVLPAGHGPWLGEPARTAGVLMGFVREGPDRPTAADEDAGRSVDDGAWSAR